MSVKNGYSTFLPLKQHFIWIETLMKIGLTTQNGRFIIQRDLFDDIVY